MEVGDIFRYKKKKVVPRVEHIDIEDKHVAMMQSMTPLAKKVTARNLTDVEIKPATKKLKVLFLLLPEWSANFPPFNIARLSAVTTNAGYETKAIDYNVEAFNYVNVEHSGALFEYNPWDGARDWHWNQEHYMTDIHPVIKEVYDRRYQEILDFKPDLVCFTMYYCNYAPSEWLAQQIKKDLPNVKIATGGPFLQTNAFQIKEVKVKDSDKKLFDYGVTGEGEILILKILSEIEAEMNHSETQIYTQPSDQRINLNNLPLPDYRHFDFNKYEFPNGILTEFSRGCVAKCTFCEETHFWKYRQRDANDALNEIEKLYYTKGSDVVFFIDSLVNGNLKELRNFCEGVVEKQLDIHWTGYSRCDGRMDREFYELLAASGCTYLNYGCESASQKVLDDMDKRVKVHEMEQNFKDGKAVGIGAMTNWIVAFPTEDFQDFADTLTFLWRNRNNGIIIIATASGYGIGDRTITGQNPERFNIADVKYCGRWIARDFSKGKPHTLHRVKEFVMFLQQVTFGDRCYIPPRPNLPVEHYTLTWHDPSIVKEIEYENFDYSIIKTGISKWADNLVNEMFVLFRMLWRTRGGFDMTVKYDIDLDLKEFGKHVAGEYIAEQTFSITQDGDWKASIKCEFIQPEHNGENTYPFVGFDFTNLSGATAERARKLARNKWGDEGRPKEEVDQIFKYAWDLNHNKDLSFEFEWSGTGKWTEVNV